MPLKVPNNSEVFILEYILNKTTPDDIDIRLYTNDITPSDTDTITTYTEATGFGYAMIQLVPANWAIVAGNPSVASHTQVTFVFTGALGNVYGYMVTKRASGVLMWAERFNNGPYNIQNNGDEVKITPKLSLE